MINEGVNQFFYNGKRSYDDMNLIITETPMFSSPERDITFTSVAGKNGDIVTDNKRFKNVDGIYKVSAISDDFTLRQTARKIKNWLQGAVGYFTLSDTYDPNYFRHACYSGKIDIENKMNILGNATLTFNCKPFKYSFDGQQELQIATSTVIYNPEDWNSEPYLKIIGNGDITISINNDSFMFHDIEEYIEVDGETQLAYKGVTLQSEKTTFIEFPTLYAGENFISFTGEVEKIIIIPRWCCL